MCNTHEMSRVNFLEVAKKAQEVLSQGSERKVVLCCAEGGNVAERAVLSEEQTLASFPFYWLLFLNIHQMNLEHIHFLY